MVAFLDRLAPPPADLRIDSLTQTEVIDRVVSSLARGQGGRALLVNVDVHLLVSRDLRMRKYRDACDLVLLDGAPLLLSVLLEGRRLPHRVAGSDLIEPLVRAVTKIGQKVLLLGSSPESSAAAAHRLSEVCGEVVHSYSPPIGRELAPEQLHLIRSQVASPDVGLVLCAFGAPRQELLIDELAGDFPGVWFVPVGAGVDFISGAQVRAPTWLRKLGFEWLFRLIGNPRRLFRRYLGRDLPFLIRMCVRATKRRVESSAVAA